MPSKPPLRRLLIPLAIDIGGICLCLFGIWWLIGAQINRYREEQLLAAGSQTAVGTVLARNSHYDSDSNSTSYTVRYRYSGLTSEDERRYEHEATTSASVYHSSEVGGPIAVRYASADPSIARIADEPGLIARGIGAILLVLCALVGIAIAGAHGLEAVSDWRYARRQTQT